MRIVNTFISETNSIPEYTETCLRQARKFNPSIEIDFISKEPASYFSELKINWVDQAQINSEELDNFKKLSWFNRKTLSEFCHLLSCHRTSPLSR